MSCFFFFGYLLVLDVVDKRWIFNIVISVVEIGNRMVVIEVSELVLYCLGENRFFDV